MPWNPTRHLRYWAQKNSGTNTAVHWLVENHHITWQQHANANWLGASSISPTLLYCIFWFVWSFTRLNSHLHLRPGPGQTPRTSGTGHLWDVTWPWKCAQIPQNLEYFTEVDWSQKVSVLTTELFVWGGERRYVTSCHGVVVRQVEVGEGTRVCRGTFAVKLWNVVIVEVCVAVAVWQNTSSGQFPLIGNTLATMFCCIYCVKLDWQVLLLFRTILYFNSHKNVSVMCIYTVIYHIFRFYCRASDGS